MFILTKPTEGKEYTLESLAKLSEVTELDIAVRYYQQYYYEIK